VTALFASCSDEINSAAVGGYDKIETHDYDGYSVGSIINENNLCSLNARVDLGYKTLEVDDAVFGKITNVEPTNPVTVPVSMAGKFGATMTRDFSFTLDGQTAHAAVQWIADSLASYYYEVTDIVYIDYTTELVNAEGTLCQLTPHFRVGYRHSTDALKGGAFDMYPRYYHVKKGAVVVDSLLVTTHNYEGHADGQVVNVLGFTSAEATLTLAKASVEVVKSQLGQLSLVNESPASGEDISTTAKVGQRYTKNFTFSDTQTGVGIYQYLYDLGAENHLEITGISYVDYTTEAIDAESLWMIPHFEVSYRRLGNETASGVFDLYPRYKQIAKEEVPTYTYTVEPTVKDKENDGIKTRRLTVKISKYNAVSGDLVEDWKFQGNIAISGMAAGYDLFVSSPEILNKDYTDYEATDGEYNYTRPVEGNEKFIETRTTHIWRFRNHWTADVGGDVYTDSQILFQSSVITFADGDFTWGSDELGSLDKDVKVIYDKIDQDTDKLGQARDENSLHYTYGGTHRLTVQNILNGQPWHSSTAVSPLWVVAP
jgi:hypothetical protein